MNSPEPLALSANGLEAIKYDLRSFRKSNPQIVDWDFAYTASALKKYITGNFGVVLSHRSTDDDLGDYHLLFYRVPVMSEANITSGAAPYVDIGDREAGGRCGCGEANCMLVVRHMGDFTDKIISAGKAWSCRVWLLSQNLIDEGLGKPAFLFHLSHADDPLHAGESVGPRVVLSEPQAAHRVGGGVEGLIEGMLDIDDCVSERPFHIRRGCLDQLELRNSLSSIKVILDHQGEGTILEVTGGSLIPSFETHLCPIDGLLRGFESLHV